MYKDLFIIIIDLFNEEIRRYIYIIWASGFAKVKDNVFLKFNKISNNTI